MLNVDANINISERLKVHVRGRRRVQHYVDCLMRLGWLPEWYSVIVLGYNSVRLPVPECYAAADTIDPQCTQTIDIMHCHIICARL